MTNGSKSAFWNSKGLMLDLIRRAKEINEKNSSIDENNYLAEKKGFMVELKKFDKDYIKHKKNVHPEINGFIQTAFIPLVNVLESNMEFHKLEKLIKNGAEIPDFRVKALEEKFCGYMEVLFKILTNHSSGKFKDEYNIQRMLNILKNKGWQDSHPMYFYL